MKHEVDMSIFEGLTEWDDLKKSAKKWIKETGIPYRDMLDDGIANAVYYDDPRQVYITIDDDGGFNVTYEEVENEY